MSTRLRTTGNFTSVTNLPHYYEYCRGTTACSINSELVGYCNAPLVGTTRSVWDEAPHKYPAKGTYSILPFKREEITVSYGGSGMKRKNSTPYNSCNTGNCTYKNWVVADDWSWFLTNWSGQASVTHPTFHVDVPALRNEALIVAKANAKTPEVMGLVFIGELQQTLNLVMRPWEGVVKLLRSFVTRKGRTTYVGIVPTRATAKAAAELHLQFIYGVLPLMKDCESALRVLQEKRQEMQRFYGVCSDTSETITNSSSSNGVDKINVKTTVTETVTARAGVCYQFDVTMSDRFGMSLANIPSSAYELIPFSFVLDWAINVGDFIAASVPIPGATYMGGYTVVDSTVSVRREVTSHTSDSASWAILRPCQDWDNVVFKTKQRYPEEGTVGLPTFNLRLNTGKVASLLSLLTVLSNGFRSKRAYRL